MNGKKFSGLNLEEVEERQKKYGKNELNYSKNESIIKKFLKIISEPMFILLISASIIYFILGEPVDGFTMLIFIIGIVSIDFIQEYKTDKTLEALKNLSDPNCEVIRCNKRQNIHSSELVPDDILIVHEGEKIPGDAQVLDSHALLVKESILTGESEPIYKEKGDQIYTGTLVVSGTATCKVLKTGINTEYGKIGKEINNINADNSPLQKEIDHLIKICFIIAIILCLCVGLFTFIELNSLSFKERLISSLLSGITLAMAMIPEEFPVIFTVFLSLGAWRLAKDKALVKKLSSVETLGSVSILCVDKTGTITQNNMKVQNIWSLNYSEEKIVEKLSKCLTENTYDPMEKAIIEKRKKMGIDKPLVQPIKEYAFDNKIKMMGSIYKENRKNTLYVKGAPEAVLKITDIDEITRKKIAKKIEEMANSGLRVLAVCDLDLHAKDIRDELSDYKLKFAGLIGLADPPKDDIKDNIVSCNNAGIKVVMITGDSKNTASSIAKSVGIKDYDKVMTGEELDSFTDEELKTKVLNTTIFARVTPEHKLRIVKLLKMSNEVVAMTGDGVNDAPALKAADIGIAMGNKGSDVAREAADLVLLDDNFSTIVNTIKDGRRIYDNIKRAIYYIFTIHIPIAFSSILAPILNLPPDMFLFLPIHIVLMELIIDPTSSVVLERIPAEPDIMDRKPREKNSSLVNFKELFRSVFQGIFMFIISFTLFYVSLKCGKSITVARTMGILSIVITNVILVISNYSINNFFINLKKILKDKFLDKCFLILFCIIVIALLTPIREFLNLDMLSLKDLSITILVSITSIIWFEIFKFGKNKIL